MYRRKYRSRAKTSKTIEATAKFVALLSRQKLLKREAEDQDSSDNDDVDEPDNNLEETIKSCDDENDTDGDVSADDGTDESSESSDDEGTDNDNDNDDGDDDDDSDGSETEKVDPTETWLTDYTEKMARGLEEEELRKFVQQAVDVVKHSRKQNKTARLVQVLDLVENLLVPQYMGSAGEMMAFQGYASELLKLIKKEKTSTHRVKGMTKVAAKAWAILIGFTDCCKRFSKAVSAQPIVRIMKKRLEAGQGGATSEPQCYFELTMLYLMARDGRSKDLFIKENIIEIIKPYLESTDECTKVYTFFIMTHIAKEQEIRDVAQMEGMIWSCMTWLQKDLHEENTELTTSRHGLHPWEIAFGLAKIAAVDADQPTSIAQLLVKKGALGILLELLQKDDPKSQSAAALFLWNLAFDKSVKDTMKSYLNLPECLRKLKKSHDKKVKDYVSGALWTMCMRDTETDVGPLLVDRAISAQRYDVFISYSWKQQKLAQRLCDDLKASGYTVWFDVNEMTGSTLDAMAAAVESSHVVIVCVSEDYKNSTNCKTEAQYSYKRNKVIIPVIVQEGYEPDLWLGALVGLNLYFKLVGDEYDTELEKLYKELERRLESSHTDVKT